MDAAADALSAVAEPTPERVHAVLEERARVLARPVASPSTGNRLELVTFALAGEICAIESRYVVQVFQLRELSPLPGARPPIFGVTAWRGDLLTILDLRAVLGLSLGALNDLTRVIVLGLDHPAFGILADAVREVVTVADDDVQPPPEGIALRRDYLRGMTAAAVAVLDGRRVLRLLEPDVT
jgi:purine-binding chemotaxis protein CheW